MSETDTVTTYYLEMLDRRQLRPKRLDADEWSIRQAASPSPELNRFLYAAVGWEWSWSDKRNWDYEQWAQYVDRDELQTWIGYWQGTPAGYFELEWQEGANVEILYFGLMRRFIGRGLGGALLTAAIERAWDRGARRVWVHTCDRDHPLALSNYLSRGFTQYDVRTTAAPAHQSFQNPW